MHLETSNFCVSIVTVMLLLQVKQLKSAEYSINNVNNILRIYLSNFFSFTIRKHVFL